MAKKSAKGLCRTIEGFRDGEAYLPLYRQGKFGRSKKKCGLFDMRQLEKGIRVEQEHTNSRELATKIALDHLVENPKYYDWLECMETAMDAKTDRERERIICEQGMGGEYQDNVYEWDGRKAVCKKTIEKRRW